VSKIEFDVEVGKGFTCRRDLLSKEKKTEMVSTAQSVVAGTILCFHSSTWYTWAYCDALPAGVCGISSVEIAYAVSNNINVIFISDVGIRHMLVLSCRITRRRHFSGLGNGSHIDYFCKRQARLYKNDTVPGVPCP